MPSWDLAALLEALKESPFELLCVSTFTRTENWSRVILRPDPAFTSKTDLAGDHRRILKPIIIEALRFAESHVKDQDKTLCPVRALMIYIRKIDELREGKQKLFVAFEMSYKTDIVKNTVSFWIQKVIFATFYDSPEELQGKFRIRAHNIRALASFWVFFRNTFLVEVMDMFSWKVLSTFFRHYFRDLTDISGNLYKLVNGTNYCRAISGLVVS